MKHVISFLLLATTLLPSAAWADLLTVDSKIIAATVYNNRAKVTRTAKVKIPAGEHTIIFKGLTAALLPDSLRAEGSAVGDVVFGAVAHKRVNSLELSSIRERALNDQLVELKDQLTFANTEKSALGAQRVFLENIGRQAKLRTNEQIAEIKLNPEQWGNASKSIYSGLSDTLKANVQQDIKIRKLNQKITKTQSELNQVRTNQRLTYEVSIPLESNVATELSVDLSYQVPNATWKPIYDARLNTEGKGTLNLVQYGAVNQRTGEDWSDVRLTLSTAQPHRGTSLESFSPWWINIWDGKRRNRNTTNSRGKSFVDVTNNITTSHSSLPNVLGMFGGSNERKAAAPKQQQARFAAANVQTGGFVTEYSILGPSSILADGTETKLMVGGFDTTSKLQIHIKPQMSGDAFLVAKSKIKGESPMLAGQVNLFRDGAYVGKTSIPLLRPNEEHAFFFGIDDQVSVKQKVLKDERQETGVITRDSVLERHFMTEIHNLHTDPIEVIFKQVVPVGQDERIQSEILPMQTTKGYEEDSADVKGMLRWKFTMLPKDKKKMTLGWKLTWPKDDSILGL